MPDAALPDDLDALKALVAHLTEQVTGQARTIQLQDRQIETLRLQLEELEARWAERQPADEQVSSLAREGAPIPGAAHWRLAVLPEILCQERIDQFLGSFTGIPSGKRPMPWRVA